MDFLFVPTRYLWDYAILLGRTDTSGMLYEWFKIDIFAWAKGLKFQVFLIQVFKDGILQKAAWQVELD